MNAIARKRIAAGPTRRQFLAGTAAAIIGGTHSLRSDTGLANTRLARFDEMMIRFLRDEKPPGAALAVSYRGHLVYSRGFGLADREKAEPVEPHSLFRIASISKPFTATAVMHLIQNGRITLEDKVFHLLKLEPGQKADPRLHDIEVRHCLQHTGGWDRDKTFDPMSAATAEKVAKALKVPLPVNPQQIIEYMMGQPLDFAPGTAYAYSNFGYCVLGRVIQAVSGKPYHEFVEKQILAPLGIRGMKLGKNLLADRAPDEVKYYDSKNRQGRAICGPAIGKPAPLPYGVESIEAMDANGGWIASAADLVRFAAAFDDPKKCPVLSEASLAALLAPPPGPVGHRPNGKPKATYYGCGWQVRPTPKQPGKCTKWHAGGLSGSSTLLVCRSDGINWAALFNGDANTKGEAFADLIDPLLHEAVDAVKEWPEIDLFQKA